MSRRDELPANLDPVACCAPVTGNALSATDAEALARVFKALADPARLRLLSMISNAEGGEACVCELTVGFELTGPTISHHLKVLREAGLIEGDRRGTWIYYRALPRALEAAAAALAPGPMSTNGGSPSTRPTVEVWCGVRSGQAGIELGE